MWIKLRPIFLGQHVKWTFNYTCKADDESRKKGKVKSVGTGLSSEPEKWPWHVVWHCRRTLSP